MSKICNNFILSPVVISEKYKYLEASCSLLDERKRNSRISTRGASKQRRDQINNELTEIRNILPLSSIMRQNLYQLQILSLCCTYIRCYNYLNIFNKDINNSSNSSLLFCTINALNDNFLIGITEEGNLLALSENFSQDKDPISTIEWMAQSDSIFDLLDPDDHQILKEIIFNENKIENNIAFVCRWKAPKLGGITKRQPDWNGKPTLVNGRFISSQIGNKKMFIALCRPILFSENSFYKHKDPSIMRFWLDQNFKIEALCQNTHYLLFGQLKSFNSNLPSFYNFIHPLFIKSLTKLHKKLLLINKKTTSNVYRLLLPLICFDYSIYYAHFIFIIKNDNLIEAICQQINDLEVLALEKCNWIYNLSNNYIEEKEEKVYDFITKNNINEEKSENLIKNSENKKDLNNNNIIINNLNNNWDSKNENKLLQNYNNNSFDELPSLSILPELDDKDLDEFFRIVEQ